MVPSKQSIGKTEEKVVQAVSDAESGGGHSLIRLSSGVTLKPKKVNGFLIQEVMRQFQKPKPPLVMNEDLGREIENDSDPGYIQAMTDYNVEITIAIVDLFIVAGTELHGAVPKGIPGLNDLSWQNDLEAIGIRVGPNPSKKYILWVKFVAAPLEEDTTEIMSGVGRMSGVAEADVKIAAERFRTNSRRRTNNRSRS